MSASDVRAILCAAAVLGAVLATLAMTGCASAPKPVARVLGASCAMPAGQAVLDARQAQRDGFLMVLGECETRAEVTAPGLAVLAYESCLNEHGMAP